MEKKCTKVLLGFEPGTTTPNNGSLSTKCLGCLPHFINENSHSNLLILVKHLEVNKSTNGNLDYSNSTTMMCSIFDGY